MRKILTILIVILGCTATFAQDIIVKKDGSIIQSRVQKIGTQEVEYKKWTNQDGPTYSIAISDILAINYQNGEKETFENKSTAAKEDDGDSNEPKLVKKEPDARNAEIIGMHNKYRFVSDDPVDDSDAKEGFAILNIDESSVMSNDELEMSFELCTTPTYPDYPRSGYLCYHYEIKLTNKTDKIIYIDLANCFRMNEDAVSDTYCYYSGEQTKISKGGGSGASMNMGAVAGALGVGGAIGTLAGGLNVGGGSNSAVEKTYEQQRIIIIPPHGSRHLTEWKYVQVKSTKYEIPEQAEEYNWGVVNSSNHPIYSSYEKILYAAQERQTKLKRGDIKKNEIKTYSLEDSPAKINYSIIYSTSNTFQKYSMLNARLYISNICGKKQWQMGGFRGDYKGFRIENSNRKFAYQNYLKMFIPNYDNHTLVAPIGFPK